MALALETTGLVKDYGSLRAVDNVNLAIEEGEVFGLLGPNGAGKTSIISMIVTLERPTEGSVKVFDKDVMSSGRIAKSMTGLVPQELINHGYFDVEEVLQFYSGYFGLRKNQERIDYLLKRLQLWDHRKKRVKQLSGGMKRRLLIAKALLHRPKLLLLDEPTAGVDIELRASLWEFVEELRREGMSILLTTHYIEEAEQLCDRVGFLQNGRLKRVGATKDLIQDLTQRELRFQIDGGASMDLNHPDLIHREGDQLLFRIPSSKAMGELLLDLNIDIKKIKDLHITEGNLEEAFRKVLGEN